MIEELEARVHASFVAPGTDPDVEAVEETIRLLDAGQVRVAESQGDGWRVHAWVKEAVLLFFRVRGLATTEVGPFEYHDRLPLKTGYAAAGGTTRTPAAS